MRLPPVAACYNDWETYAHYIEARGDAFSGPLDPEAGRQRQQRHKSSLSEVLAPIVLTARVYRSRSDDAWVRAKDRVAAAAAARCWRRFSKRLAQRPAMVFNSIFMLLDPQQKGCVSLSSALGFLSFALPFTMPAERNELLRMSMADAANSITSHSSSSSSSRRDETVAPIHHAIHGSNGGGTTRSNSSAALLRGGQHLRNPTVLLRADFVDLCLRLLWSIPLSQLELCVEQYTKSVADAALPIRWIARTRSTLDAARHAAEYRRARVESLLATDRRIKARRAAERAARDHWLRERFLAERTANERAAANVATARAEAVQAEAERREEKRKAALAPLKPLPGWYVSSGDYL